MEGNDYKYWAFISYSHADNREAGRKWADWLHGELESFRTPHGLAGSTGRDGDPVPERLVPVFQDEKELPASADLGIEIEHALVASRNLIVICSPRSARSLWVEQEIVQFKKLGRETRIFPLIIAGEPNASEPEKPQFDDEQECFGDGLRYEVDENGEIDRTRRTEPLAADLRLDGEEGRTDAKEMRDLLERAKLRVAAGILGVGFDDLVQREKRRQIEEAHRKARRNMILAGVFGLLAVVAIGLGVRALLNGREAERQRGIAVVEGVEADRQRGIAIVEKDEAGRQRGIAITEKNEADRQREMVVKREREIRQRLSYQSVANGWRSWEESDPGGAFLWFGEALRLAEASGADATDLEKQNSVAQRRRLRQILIDERELRKVSLYEGGFDHSVFNKAADRMVTVRFDREIQLWNAATGLPLAPPGRITGAAELVLFNASQDRLLVIGPGGGQLWDVQTGQPVEKPITEARSGKFSASGKRFVVRDAQNRLRVFDAQSSRPLTNWLSAGETVSETVITKEDDALVVILGSGEIATFDLATGKEEGGRWGPGVGVRYASGNAETGRLFLWTADDTGRFWDLEKKIPVNEPIGELASGDGFAWSKSGTFARGEFNGSDIFVWHSGTGKTLLGPLKGYRSSFSDSETYFKWEQGSALAESRHIISVWDLKNRKPAMQALDFSRDPGRRARFTEGQDDLLVENDNAPTRRWILTTGKEQPTPRSHRSKSHSWKESDDGRFLATLADENTLEIRDTQQADKPPVKLDYGERIIDFALTSTGDKVAVYLDMPPFEGGTIAIVNSSTGEGIGALGIAADIDPDKLPNPLAHFTIGFYRNMEFSRDGSLLLIQAQKPEENAVYAPLATWIWNVNDGNPLATLSLPEDDRREVLIGGPDEPEILSAVMKNGLNRVFVNRNDGSIEAFDTEDGSKLARLDLGQDANLPLFPSGHFVKVTENTAQVIDILRSITSPEMRETAEIRDAVLSPDGKLLALTHFEPVVRVWDVETGKPVTESFETEGVFINYLEFSPDGTRLFTASRGPSNPPIAYLRFFDVKQNVALTPSLFSEERVWQGTFDAAGERIVASGNKKGARVFDAANGNLLLPPMLQEGGTYQSRFSPGGKHIGTGSNLGKLRLWDSATAAPTTPVLDHGTGSNLSINFNSDGTMLVSTASDVSSVLWQTATGQRLSGEIEGTQFVGFGPGEKDLVLLIKESGILRTRDITPVEESAEFWSIWSMLRSGRQIAPSTVPLPLNSAETYALWEKLREKLDAK